MRVAVVGHVEWVEFARVDHVPGPGDIAHASETFAVPAGGGAVAAVQLRRLAGSSTLYTALGEDDHGRRAKRELETLGVRVECCFRTEPQRRAITLIDPHGERTITTLGPRLAPLGSDPLPWEELAETDAVYFTAGDAGALRAARRAGVLLATSRETRTLAAAGVALDALVGSAHDPAETYEPGTISPEPSVVVRTEHELGGSFTTAEGRHGRYEAAPLPGPLVDTYGAGDTFAAGLTYGLGAGLSLDEALALGARLGATCLTGRGPYGAAG
jgi:ribokinase